MITPSVERMVRSGLARSVSTPTRREARKTGLSMVLGKERARRAGAGLSTKVRALEFRAAPIGALLHAERARHIDATGAELLIIADVIRRAENAVANLGRRQR